MKTQTKYIFITFFFISFFGKSQVAIEKDFVDGNSTILDFLGGTTKGIILPAVDTAPISPVNGTFILDKSDIKLKMFENDVWVPLSDIGNISNLVTSGSIETGNGVIIGANTSTAQGVLVLESLNKSLLLPKVNTPHLNVKSPYPGMICYDTQSKTVAIFDGNVWNYWK